MRPGIVRSIVALLCLFYVHQAFAGEIRREMLASKHLAQDLPFLVYVPDGYASSGLNYPVLYLLHGFGDNERAWVERGSIREKMDRLIAARIIPPALIVMPGCAQCWWADGGGGKDLAESAFWNELVPAVASRYRTLEAREGRVVAGLSAGGYGAVRFALKYPERVVAAAAFSPAIYAEEPPPASAARIRSPFIGSDGKFNKLAWSEQNYPRLIERYFQQTKRVPMYLVSGDNDKLGIAFETALLFKRLFEKQPDEVELRVVDGGHSWAVWASAVDEAITYLFRFTAKPSAGNRQAHSAAGPEGQNQSATP